MTDAYATALLRRALSSAAQRERYAPMSATDERIAGVQALIEQQLQLLTVSLFICDKGRADFAEKSPGCALSEKMRAAVVPMSPAGGQPIGTVLQSTQGEESRIAAALP